MFIINPMVVRPENITATGARMSEYPAWSAGAVYSRGDRVFLLSTRKDYVAERRVGPEDITPDRGTIDPDDPAKVIKWTEIGTANRWKPFDRQVSSQTLDERADGQRNVFWTIQATQDCNAVAVINSSVSSIRVVVRNAASALVADVTRNQSDASFRDDPYDYFFAPQRFYADAVFQNLRIKAGDFVTVHLNHSLGDPLRVGEIVIGYEVKIGNAMLGSRIGLLDYSRKETDEFGNATIIPRAYADTATFSVSCDPLQLSRIYKLLASVRAKPAVYHTGEKAHRMGTVVYGFPRDVPATIETNTHATLTLEIEGLT